MQETKRKIAQITDGMDFGRKAPISTEEKNEADKLYTALGDALKKINKLHLSLWYAVEKGEYRTMSLDEAKQQLREIQIELERLI